MIISLIVISFVMLLSELWGELRWFWCVSCSDIYGLMIVNVTAVVREEMNLMIWMDVNALIAAKFCKIGLLEIGLLMVINTFSKKSALNVEKEPLAKNMFPLER
jgi:hypothetical protein